jgi:hypothetical protein
MPKVIIVQPNNTPEQEKKALCDIARCMENIIETEYGQKIKVTLFKEKPEEKA